MTVALLDPHASDLPATTLSGDVIRPGDARYDEARRIANGLVDARPLAIVRCAGEDDVIAAARYARERGVPLAIRGGGHSPFAVVEGGIVVDLSQLKKIAVDPVARTARVSPGVVWAELDAATQEHGLAVTGGRASSVGVVGFTLGSGSGWLERAFGLASDNLVSARVVTADGDVVRASADENPELFFGLRGGGGNFGVVTELELRLHELGPIVQAGVLLYDAARAAEIARRYRDYVEAAPDEVCGGLALRLAPPAPFVPEHVRGRPVIAAVFLYAGRVADGARELEHLEAILGPPVAAMRDALPYAAFQRMFDPPPGATPVAAAYRFGFLPRLSTSAIDAVVTQAARLPSPAGAVILQPLGGAVARGTGTALARDARWIYQAVTVWDDTADAEANTTWVTTLGAALEVHASPARFPNFMSERGDEAVRHAYGRDTYDRLVAVKDRWDPENVFSVNQNIRPSGHAGIH